MGPPVSDEQLIKNMRSRVERCRRLAKGCTDLEVARTLMGMADEGEADIARLLAERNDQPRAT